MGQMKKLSSEIGELAKAAEALAEKAGTLGRMPGNTPETAAWLTLYERDVKALIDRAPLVVWSWAYPRGRDGGASDAG